MRLIVGWKERHNDFAKNINLTDSQVVERQRAFDKLLDGSSEKQIEAIWYYLTLGTSAADPSGVRATETILTVADTTRTYRGRSSVAGYRGIAVGFPEKLNYAFNAETGTLAALWSGGFVRVDRSGQGSGGFNPAAKHHSLAQDVSFAELKATLNATGEKVGLKIDAQHEDVFKFMHRI